MMNANELCEEQLLSGEIRQLINLTFDAIIIEHLWFQCYYALVHHYNFPPLVGFLSVGNLPYVMDSVGNPDDPLLNPDMAFAFNERMDTFEQFWNYLYTLWSRVYFKFIHLPHAGSIARKLIPDTSVHDIQSNFSLVLLGNNHVFGYPKPLLPNVVELHGLHISDKPNHLPTDLKNFLDESTDGVIYFSLGSNLQTHQLPSHIQVLICRMFNSLEQRVVWKHDGVLFVNSNVKLVKWAPQHAILAHPNTKLYIMQGGLQSLQEAVHYNVPLIALPFFGDQNFNARKIVDLKIGLSLDIDSLTEESFTAAVKEVLDNKIYENNIRKISAELRDEQIYIKPLNNAVWHIEHLMKFPHASRYKYYGREISYLRYYGSLIVIMSLCSVTLYLFTLVITILCNYVWQS